MAKRKQAEPASAAGLPSKATPKKTPKASQPKATPSKVTSSKATRSKSLPPKKVARPKSSTPARGNSIGVTAAISRRLREIRQELFGDHGGPELARRLNLPARTWYNYETGVSVPAEVLLRFIQQTGAEPWWVLSGEGTKFRKGHQP